MDRSKLVEVRSFKFLSDEELYGFVTVGPKVFQVLPKTLAAEIGVQVGWHVAGLNDVGLPGALDGDGVLCRRTPSVTTEELRSRLAGARAAAVRQGTAVRVTFWTRPLPLYQPPLEDRPPMKANSVADLRRLLVERHGSLTAAWAVMDSDHSGSLTYSEFLIACHQVGFAGSMRKAFQEMDTNGNGVVQLHELDPTFGVDCRTGACVICGNTNPCCHHTAQEQERALINQRLSVERRALAAREAERRRRGRCSCLRRVKKSDVS